MSDRIKTAFERAMERVAKINISGEEIDRENFRVTGKSLAARFIGERNFDLEAAVAEFPEEARIHVTSGILESLIANLHLPADETIAETNKRVMDGILRFKRDRQTVLQIFSELEYLFDYYRQALRQARLNLRDAFEKKVAETQKLIEQQTGVRMRVDPEATPGFKEEWLKTLHQIDVQYADFLKEHRSRLAVVE